MQAPDWKGPLGEALQVAVEYLEGLPERPLNITVTAEQLRTALGGPLPEQPGDPREVVAALAAAADPGVMASAGGRYFGFVVGGSTPAALAADWLASAWDQNAGLYAMGPAAAVVEDVAGAWLAELLGLPAGVSVGFVTGAQLANLTGLTVGLHKVLADAGWDVAAQGLFGAPPVRVLVGEGRHGTIDRALRFLGVGTAAVVQVAADDQGRMLPAALASTLDAAAGPVIVAAQVGNVNSGAIDPVGEISDLAHAHGPGGAWVHVDGAFGLWAAAGPGLRPLVAGVERADSWATDGHKWLNVPYDSGLVFTAHPDLHRAAMGVHSGYLLHGREGERDGIDWVPDHSRRARGFAVYAAIRALGRQGIADLVEGCCALARRFADRLAADHGVDGVEVLNDVVLNQVLVSFGTEERTREVVARVQQEGTAWLSGSTWQGRAVMRISVSNWSTDADDVDATVAMILRCAGE